MRYSTPLKLLAVAGFAALAAGCVSNPNDPYYDGGGYGGGGYGYPSGGGSVIYVDNEDYQWRERNWRNNQEREAARRDWERRDAERRREADRREAERRRDNDRRDGYARRGYNDNGHYGDRQGYRGY